MYKDNGINQKEYAEINVSDGSGKWWGIKLAICMMYDSFDFTLGRALFAIPFAGELLGMALCYAMFGKQGLFYGLEAIDMTEQIDGFIPTATIIAFMNKPQKPNSD